MYALGADIELGASTPIMEAVQEGHYNLVKVLVERGAKANAVSSNGDSALVLCCSWSRLGYGEINCVGVVIDLLIFAYRNTRRRVEGRR